MVVDAKPEAVALWPWHNSTRQHIPSRWWYSVCMRCDAAAATTGGADSPLRVGVHAQHTRTQSPPEVQRVHTHAPFPAVALAITTQARGTLTRARAGPT